MIIHQSHGVTLHVHRREQAMRVLDAAAKRAFAAGFVILCEHYQLGTLPKVLLVKRSMSCESYPGTWAFPGGSIDPGEDAYTAALREVREEVGINLKGSHEDCGVHKGFHTYLHNAHAEFDCTLNHEHDAYTWARLNQLPRPMHPNAADILTTIRTAYEPTEKG